MDSESGGEVVITARNPWTVNGGNMGTFEPGSILASLPGLGSIDCAQLTGKTICQLRRGQKDGRWDLDPKGRDVGGYFVVADAGAALLFPDTANARRWANDPNQVNIDIAPSLTCVPSGHSSVSLVNFTQI